MSRYPYIDRNPCIVAAGKSFGDPRDTIKDVFQDIKLQDKVDAIRRQFGFIDTEAYSQEWIKRPDIDTSGAFTEIRHSLRRPIPTQFQMIEEEIKSTIYDSYWNKPLGKTRDHTPGLPRGMNPMEVTFGMETKISEPAGAVINPPKKAEQVQMEDRLFHDLYAFTHQDYHPGERIKRDYTPSFNECNFFGKPSKKDESGSKTKRCLTWFNNDPLSNVSRRQAAVRNRTLPSLGKGLDKTEVSDLFPVDHTFGKPTPKDFYGVEDLLNECTPSVMRRDVLVFLSYANSLRQCVYKKINSGEMTLEDLFEEIMTLNKDKKEGDTECTVDFDHIDWVMKRHRIYLDRSKIEPLLLLFGLINEDGKIKARDFIGFVDRNTRFPELKREHYILPPEFQAYNEAKPCEVEAPNKNFNSQFLPPAGLPTIRLDKLHPVYEHSIINMDNLGDETTARTLISPSIYTQYGLSHRDFLKPRSKEFLVDLFRKINVTIPDDEFDEIYKEGCNMDRTGGVCVETFRNLLDVRAYKAHHRIL